MSLAHYLYAIVYSGVYNSLQWQLWAIKLLENAEYNDNTEWVYNIAFLNNREEFFNIIYNTINEQI